MLLDENQRKNAPFIYQILKESLSKTESMNVGQLKQWVVDTINTNPYLETEYYDIVDELSLQSIGTWDHKGGKFGCIAVKVGKIRLIDNIRYNL
jgi:pantoate--beta-alanine ligase